jgi:hypothetical protein
MADNDPQDNARLTRPPMKRLKLKSGAKGKKTISMGGNTSSPVPPPSASDFTQPPMSVASTPPAPSDFTQPPMADASTPPAPSDFTQPPMAVDPPPASSIESMEDSVSDAPDPTIPSLTPSIPSLSIPPSPDGIESSDDEPQEEIPALPESFQEEGGEEDAMATDEPDPAIPSLTPSIPSLSIPPSPDGIESSDDEPQEVIPALPESFQEEGGEEDAMATDEPDPAIPSLTPSIPSLSIPPSPDGIESSDDEPQEEIPALPESFQEEGDEENATTEEAPAFSESFQADEQEESGEEDATAEEDGTATSDELEDEPIEDDLETSVDEVAESDETSLEEFKKNIKDIKFLLVDLGDRVKELEGSSQLTSNDAQQSDEQTARFAGLRERMSGLEVAIAKMGDDGSESGSIDEDALKTMRSELAENRKTSEDGKALALVNADKIVALEKMAKLQTRHLLLPLIQAQQATKENYEAPPAEKS